MTALKSLSRGAETGVAPLPAYGARDLTEGGDQARIVLDDQVYNRDLSVDAEPGHTKTDHRRDGF